MNGHQLRLQLSLVLAILVVCSLAAQAPAWAQAGEGWSYVITPQVWISHISKNGFVSPSAIAGAQPDVDPSGNILTEPFQARNSRPVDDLDPQWGLQLAAQKGRLTLAGAFQYVNFETVTDIVYTPSNGLPLSLLFPCTDVNNRCLFPGDRAVQEFVNTTRMDMDFAASYLFPDVVQNRLDLSIGSGFKFIYASASRNYGNLSLFATDAASVVPSIFSDSCDRAGGSCGAGSGLYLVCRRDDCLDAHFKDRVKTKAYLYGATIPMSAIFHLTGDGRWLLPFSITPFLGAETRDDQDVVYDLKCPARFDATQGPLGGCKVNRLDGTTFAYGVTSDATVRWLVNETLSVYAGMRVQYIKGHEKYLAYGPLVGMSVRFGGR